MSIVVGKNYELLEHTADIRIRVKGADLKDLFKNAALAMFDIMAGIKSSPGPPIQNITITQRADDLEELFINWLNELLSLSSVKGMIFSDFTINKVDRNNLDAVANGSDIEDYRLNTEVKAAVYHGLKIEQAQSGWFAEVIFDV